jgi:hypothetical protein
MQVSRIAKLTYAGHEVDVRIRDGYFNLTQLCHAEGKRARDLIRGKDAASYLDVVQHKTQICVSSLVERRQGRGVASIWVHPLVASWAAERLSPEAAFFIHSTLRDLHLTGIVLEVAERQLEAKSHPSSSSPEESKPPRNDFEKATKAEYDRIIEKHYGGACPCCGEVPIKWHYDHFWLRSHNLPTAGWKICDKCNLKRTAKLSRRESAWFFQRFQKFQDYVGQGELF